MGLKVDQSSGEYQFPAPLSAPNLVRELYASPHVETLNLTTKDALTEFATYNLSASKAVEWAQSKKVLTDQFMFGVNLSNSDNTINLICRWNGVTVVDNVYARPSITGAPTFGSNQNKSLDVTNEMRIQGLTGNTAYPRNHIRWRTVFNGTVDFGSLEEYSYGQNAVDISSGITVRWYYYLQGTGSITLYYDHLRVTM